MATFVDDAFRYPVRGERGVDRLAVGGLLGVATAICSQSAAALAPSLLALPFLAGALVTVVVLLGYLLRVFRATVDGDDAPPPFRPVMGLVRDGIRLIALSVGYLVVPAVVAAVTAGGLVRTTFEPNSTGFVGSVLFVTASTATLVVVAAFGYGYAAGVGRLARGDALPDAFDVRRHRPVLGHVGFFTTWVVAIMALVPGWAFLLAALSNPTPLGVASVFVAFYAHLVAARIVARGYRRASAADAAERSASTEAESVNG